MDVSVIIVNYNTCQMTAECIDSIFKRTIGLKFEVILVDNASTDGSKEYFAKDGRINYIYSNNNIGFGRANNLGYNKSSGKYVFCLNSDTLLLNNALKIFFDKMESLPKTVGCIGCMLLNHQELEIGTSYGKHLDLRGLFIMKTNVTKYNKEYHNNRCWNGEKPEYFKVGYVTGADMFIRREVISQFGLFDEDFFMYYEDTEMSWRYESHGFENGIIRGPRIIHYHGLSSSGRRTLKQSILREINHSKSEKLYFKKTGSYARYIAANCIITINEFYLILYMSLRTLLKTIIKH